MPRILSTFPSCLDGTPEEFLAGLPGQYLIADLISAGIEIKENKH